MDIGLLLLEAVTEVPWIGSLGAGGAVAGVIYLVYRDSEKRRAASDERYADLANRMLGIIESNTKAVTQVTAAVEHNTVTTEAVRLAIERMRRPT